MKEKLNEMAPYLGIDILACQCPWNDQTKRKIVDELSLIQRYFRLFCILTVIDYDSQ
jgi:hypothetical protein